MKALGKRLTARRPAQTIGNVYPSKGRIERDLRPARKTTLVDARGGDIKNVYIAPHLRGSGKAQRLMAARATSLASC